MKEAIPFKFGRDRDETGISGSGLVMVGAIFPSMKAISEWVSEKNPNSINMYDNIGIMLRLHAFLHPGNGSWMECGEYELLENKPIEVCSLLNQDTCV